MSEEVVRLAPRPAAPDRLWTPQFTTLLLAQGGFGFAFSSYFMLPKFVVSALGGGPGEVGRVTAAYGASVVLLLPMMGALVDRYGRRRFLTAGACTMAAASLGFVAVDEVGPLLYGLRLVQGLGFAMAFTAGAALAVDEAPPARLGQAIGLFGLTFLSMNVVAPAAVEGIADRFGWSAAWVLAGVGAASCCVLSRLLHDRPLHTEPGIRTAKLWEVATRPAQLRSALVILLVGVAMTSVFTFHQPFALSELGMRNVSSFLIAYASAAVFVRLVLGRLVDGLGRRRVAIGALLVYVPAVMLASELRPGLLEVFGLGLGLAHGLFYPAFNAVVVAGAARNERGKLMALFQAAFNVGFAGGALPLGHLAERQGYADVFHAGGACAALALVVLLLSPEGRVPRDCKQPGDW